MTIAVTTVEIAIIEIVTAVTATIETVTTETIIVAVKPLVLIKALTNLKSCAVTPKRSNSSVFLGLKYAPTDMHLKRLFPYHFG